MHTTPAAYHGTTVGTRLIAAVLALAGSAAVVGGNLGIAGHYAANAGMAQLATASRGDAPRQAAAIKCSSNAA